MAVFSKAFSTTMGHEGGYANNKLDTGGETYKGIARRHNPSWKGWPIIDAIQPHTAVNINKVAGANAALQEQVKAFYLVNYWNINRLTDLLDQQLAENVFDFGVNAGTVKGAKTLQQAHNNLSSCGDLTVDGVIGPKTIAAVNLLSPQKLHGEYNRLKKAHYDGIIERNPSQAVFRNSWYSRIKPYKNLA